jgi:hypothetical protein
VENRGSGLGCIVTGLGLVLGIFLLPYLISSVYSLANALWQAGGAATWLWGDWVNTWTRGDRTLYMILSEGPMCCVGALAMLIVIVGAVSIITDRDEERESDGEDEFEAYEAWEVEDSLNGELDAHRNAFASGNAFARGDALVERDDGSFETPEDDE